MKALMTVTVAAVICVLVLVVILAVADVAVFVQTEVRQHRQPPARTLQAREV